ncbi:MAG: hypothetical protein HOP19_18955 [Acidobacteria bacterium]|nr:hypothetical protein [Acidobacteriota bacterium]
MSESTTTKWYLIAAAILAGFATWIVIGGAGFLLLRTVSSSYALAEPTKAYTLPMLLARLMVGVVCTVAAGAVATATAKGARIASYWLAVVFFLLSAPIHLPIHLGKVNVSVWADYPPWYHAAYLVPLMPLTIFGGYLATRLRPQRNQ